MAFAFIFDTVSGGEWLVLLAVILIVVGPKNLPAAARKTGEILAKLRRAADEFKRQLMTMDQEVTRTVNEVAGELKQDYVDVPQEYSSDPENPDGSDYSDGTDYPDSPDYPDYDGYSNQPDADAPTAATDSATASSEAPVKTPPKESDENEAAPAAK